MPLNDMVVTRRDVNEFWERQDWDLALPKDTSLSNCVYCGWWMRIEAEYGRDLVAEERTIRSNATHIGFFGNHPFAYGDLASGRDISALNETMLPCDCTE